MSAHIIGRPDDDLLDIILGHGADPEQAFICGSEQGREDGDGFEDHWRATRPPCRSCRAGHSRTDSTSVTGEF